MTDELDPGLASLLGRADVWDEPPTALEDAVVAAISAEAGEPAGDSAAPGRRSLPSWWLAAAAVCALVVAGVALVAGRDTGEPEQATGLVIELESTDLFPGASATADLAATPAGLRIVLDAQGLPPAGPDHFYEAWVTDGTIRVSAGTFHLNGGSAPIELWAGVDDPAFRTLTVTLEPLDGIADSSGQVILRGNFEELNDS